MSALHRGQAFILVFQRGGCTGKWHMSLAFNDREKAEAAAQGNVRMGYPTYVRDCVDASETELPQGPAPYWDYEEFRWKE